ncbi:TIGR03619 family F420-dependent LLM class oxidoreductase [Kitasatospora sp. NBC_01287]|uniref:TIGR03619 family F420-dependent LLM class oxidoreductase n=1 Tax=Kitasatospora sp. NBC_01287 TaxID=2903573 RepID=UPI0022528CC8|nr:TIGR03619 family F420-dependent LLM class oxidoreductase [Kitasatospora sp. NBC_01287]MCX4746154.1 TIGR03619 family F420-dependent LLM class oxidoreductase [Kitasatospora sp. NBC_01287]
MRLHVVLPNESAETEPARITELARQAEQLGYDGLWLGDHLLPPAADYGVVYEPLVTLSYLAAATTRVRLGTSVLLLAQRNPFAVAKQVATLDRFSGGRFTLGVGLGWERQEFEAVGADFSDRAGRTDESLRLLRQLFTEGAGPFTGKRFGFETGAFSPRPGKGLKIMVGGTSPAALRRAARAADVWQSPPIDAAQFAALAAEVRRQAERPIETGARTTWEDPAVPIEQVLGELRAWDAAGAEHLAVWFGALDGFEQRMTALAAAADPAWLTSD